jgi:hypothetical protein
MIRRALFTTALVSCLACNHGHSELRGSIAPSQDGKTYLAVMDDNGGHCGPIKVDGKIWPYSIGQAGRIEPGRHTIECGGDIQFDIREGVLFKFDYWGP